MDDLRVFFPSKLFILILFLKGFVLAQATPCPQFALVQGLELHGLHHTHPAVVLRTLTQKSRTPYDSSLWTKDLRKLQGLEIFSEIRHYCKTSNDSLILHYHFTELFPYLPLPALARTDQDGWLLGGALVSLNTGGRDIWLELQTRMSLSPLAESKSVSLYTRSPWLGDLPLQWKFDFSRTVGIDNLRSYKENSWDIYGEGFWGHKQFQPLFAAGWRYDENTAIPQLAGGLVWDSRDAAFSARSGHYLEFRHSWFGQGPDLAFREHLWDFRHYFQPHSRNSFVLHQLLRLRPGQVPRNLRFHQGGTNSLRGYSPDSLRFGEQEWLATAEWRYDMLTRQNFRLGGYGAYWGLQTVLGYDAALLWNSSYPDIQHLRTAFFGGFHVLIPALERVRVELGIRPNGQMMLSVGLFEKALAQRWRNR